MLLNSMACRMPVLGRDAPDDRRSYRDIESESPHVEVWNGEDYPWTWNPA